MLLKKSGKTLSELKEVSFNPIHSDLSNKYRSVMLCKDRSSLDISSGDKNYLYILDIQMLSVLNINHQVGFKVNKNILRIF